MTQAELNAIFFRQSDEVRVPYGIGSDGSLASAEAVLATWTIEAEREGAERSRYLRTTSADDIALVAGTSEYVFPGDIVQLDSIKVSGQTRSLIRLSRELFEHYCLNEGDGVPLYFFLEENTLSVYPTPNDAGTLKIYGRRLPRGAALSETPARLHEALINWLLFRYYSIRDADMYSPDMAAAYLTRFEDVFGKKKPAWLTDMQKSAPEINHFRTSPLR
jgi:hypothetical protein